MTKKSIPLFISALILPYSMLLLSALCYRTNSFKVFIIPVILFVILNRLAVKKVLSYIALTVNLSMCTALSLYLYNHLYYSKLLINKPEHANEIYIFTSVLYVIASSVIAWFFVKFLIKSFEKKQNQTAPDKPTEQDKLGNVYSVMSFIFVLAAFVLIAVFAFLLDYGYYILIHSTDNTPELNFYSVILSIIFAVGLLFFVFGMVFSYHAVTKECLNLFFPVTARFSGFLFLALLVLTPTLILVFAAISSEITRYM